MAEILLSNHALSPKAFADQCGIDIGQISSLGCITPAMMSPNIPYVAANDSAETQGVLAQLSAIPPGNNLADLAVCYGGNQVVAMAETTANLKEIGIAFSGASTSVYANRVSAFTNAVNEYQSALMKYRLDIKSNPAFKHASKQKVQMAFTQMQAQFKQELNGYLLQNKAHKNSPLVNVKRAGNIARSSRNIAKLNIINQAQASNVVKFSKYARFLGNGLAVLDFTNRIGNIHNSYRAGNHWERDLFIESMSFATSAGAGILAVNAGSAAIGFLMVATPMGWVGLIVGGAAVAGMAAYSSMEVNTRMKNNAGNIYDDIMNSLGDK